MNKKKRWNICLENIPNRRKKSCTWKKRRMKTNGKCESQ
jgi:hypothetical protein